MKKLNPYLPYIIVCIVGLLVMSLIFPYYAFDWGIKPCTGMPTDAMNCGDADIGGVGFIFIGLPLTLLGIIGLCIRWAFVHFRRKR